MKLLHRTILFMSGALLIALTIWAVIFYINMLDEVHDSIDDGLDNSKLLIIHEAARDSTVLQQTNFDEGNYAIHRVATHHALAHVDLYKDTLMYMENEDDLEPVRLLTTVFEARDGEYYRLKVISSMVEEDDLIEDLFYSLLWLYLILVVTILGINYFVLRSLWKPFYAFLERLGRFRLGKPEPIEAVPSKIAEFQELNRVVTQVLRENVKSFEAQKQLIENTSHELQTPLTIALNKLQLLAEQAQNDEEQVTAIYSVMETLKRLSRLNQSLQLLSKIENRQFHELEEVNITTLTTELLSDFEDQLAHREITVQTDLQEALRVKMHKDLAQMLVLNLLKNAIRHNTAKGSIEVRIRSNALIVRNTGNDLALPQEAVFSRFYKSSTNPNSTGLGLAIVRSIAEVSGFEISYRFDGMHEFRVDFVPTEVR